MNHFVEMLKSLGAYALVRLPISVIPAIPLFMRARMEFIARSNSRASAFVDHIKVGRTCSNSGERTWRSGQGFDVECAEAHWLQPAVVP
jgi:hypothetical protein